MKPRLAAARETPLMPDGPREPIWLVGGRLLGRANESLPSFACFLPCRSRIGGDGQQAGKPELAARRRYIRPFLLPPSAAGRAPR